MPEQPGPADVDEQDVDPSDLATEPEDDDPTTLAGKPADPPQDAGRSEGVAP